MDTIFYIVNVEAAIYKNDKWLIIKRSEKEEHAPGLLSLVGGKVETSIAEENILENTVRREIMEEIGIKVSEKIYYVESKSFLLESGQVVIDIVFLCKYESGKPKCMSPDEVSEIYWMSSNDILKNQKAPIWLKESIKNVEKIRLKVERE